MNNKAGKPKQQRSQVVAPAAPIAISEFAILPTSTFTSVVYGRVIALDLTLSR